MPPERQRPSPESIAVAVARLVEERLPVAGTVLDHTIRQVESVSSIEGFAAAIAAQHLSDRIRMLDRIEFLEPDPFAGERPGCELASATVGRVIVQVAVRVHGTLREIMVSARVRSRRAEDAPGA
jgi:hypothetical protein